MDNSNPLAGCYVVPRYVRRKRTETLLWAILSPSGRVECYCASYDDAKDLLT